METQQLKQKTPRDVLYEKNVKRQQRGLHRSRSLEIINYLPCSYTTGGTSSLIKCVCETRLQIRTGSIGVYNDSIFTQWSLVSPPKVCVKNIFTSFIYLHDHQSLRHIIYNSCNPQNWFRSFQELLIALMYVKLFTFLLSLVIIDYWMLEKEVKYHYCQLNSASD